MYVTERFELSEHICNEARQIKPVFGYEHFSEYVFYKHYSRLMYMDDMPYANETWHDTCIRVINGVMSIRKDHYVKNRIKWDEGRWQNYGLRMLRSLIRMEWLPPGRGLWAMGSDVVYERGAMALYNCAYTDISEDWVDDLCWLMDSLMHGVGVGFGPIRTGLELHEPQTTHTFVVPDTREGWVELINQTLLAFSQGGSLPEADVHLVRPRGALIRTFGGVASGPKPLLDLQQMIVDLCYKYIEDDSYDEILLKSDLANLIGVCVVSGNVRRSAEIGIGEVDDDTFWQLKNYDTNSYREGWGWMSNNSIRLRKADDFQHMDMIARSNANGHDIGYINLKNFKRGRIGKMNDWMEFNLRVDQANGMNPCGEIPLEHREVCNLAETLPTRCVDENQWLQACEYATFYTTTVSLLPTHQSSTNLIVNRNRRVGISIIDFTGWKHTEGVANVTRFLRDGYRCIRTVATELAAEAGVPAPIRVTTIKPGGTVPKLAGRTSGAGHPTFEYTLRRATVGTQEPICDVLLKAGVPYEPAKYDPEGSYLFEFPIRQGPAPPATEVSIWEQAMNVVLLQREWADNAVSNTLYFKPMWILEERGNLNHCTESIYDPLGLRKLFRGSRSARYSEHLFTRDTLDKQYQYKIWFDHETDDYRIFSFNPNHEEDQLEAVLAAIAPLTKSVSLLPHTLKGIFDQMPEEGITKEEFERRLSMFPRIDWSSYFGSDGQDDLYCQGDRCERIDR